MPYDPIQRFYESNPRMISSPFGGIDGINTTLLNEVFAKLGIEFTGRRVVDAGCGRGYISDLVAARGGHYAGVDFVVSRKGFPLIRADVARMPFASGSADVLLCVDSSEHFPDPAAAALEFYRVLRPGGVFFLSAPNYGNVAGLVKWACEGVGLYKKHTWAPFGRWRPQELEQPLTPGFVRRIYGEAGFRVTRAIGHAPEVGLGLFPWVDHPRMPESIQFRLQKLFSAVGPRVVEWAPSASLHLFWRMDKPGG